MVVVVVAGASEASDRTGSATLPLPGPPGQVLSEQAWIIALGFAESP